MPKQLEDKVYLVKGSLQDVLKYIHAKGFYRLYIDGGKTIQSFLKHDLIDEMIITTIPILLGGGIPLFSNLDHKLEFKLKDSKVFIGEIVQNYYRRKK